MHRSRLHLYALFVALYTLLLVMIGAAVTSSRDQPRQPLLQTVHIAASIAGVVLIAGLCLWRRSGWITLGLLLAGAATGPFAPTWHAFLAALLFASVASAALITSRSWQRDPDQVRDYGRPSLRSLSAAAAFLVAVQAAFGAAFRHNAVSVMPHLLGALVVAIFIIIVGAFVTTQFPKHLSLRPLAVTLMVITGIQVFLGMGAFLLRMMNIAGSLLFLAISVAHIATGSLTLAYGVMLAMEIRRSVLPRAEEAA